MAEELVDIFDENYAFLGSALKSEARANGDWVRSIHCWVVRPEDGGFLLFQKRGQNKRVFPNALDISAAGHYKAGEHLEDGVREVKEEIGINLRFEDLIPLGIKFDIGKIGDLKVHEFCHTFLYKCSKTPSEYSLAVDEVEGLVEISIEDGLALFSGEKKTIIAKGVELNDEKGIYQDVSLEITESMFIPRIDNYYYKMLILASRLLHGEKHLVI